MSWVEDPRHDPIPPGHGESHTDEDTLWNRPDNGLPHEPFTELEQLERRLDNVMLLLTGRRRDDE